MRGRVVRGVDGYGLILREDYDDRLDDKGKECVCYVRESTQHMTQLIDDLLALSRVTRGEFRRAPVDVSAIARAVADRLAQTAPGGRVELVVADGLTSEAGGARLTVVFHDLLVNAWEFTGKRY